MKKEYKGKKFETYREFLTHLLTEIGKFKKMSKPVPEELEKIKEEVWEFAKKERHQAVIDYWKAFNTPFNDVEDIPTIDVQGKDYIDIVVPKLIECGAIPVKDLEDGEWYYGTCRNTNVAQWEADKKRFRYMRYKFGWREDHTDHFELEVYFDVFVPIRKATEQEIEEERENEKEAKKAQKEWTAKLKKAKS